MACLRLHLQRTAHRKAMREPAVVRVWCSPRRVDGLGHLLTLPVRVQKTRIQIWLYEQTSIRMEGRIIVRVWPRSVLLGVLVGAECSSPN